MNIIQNNDYCLLSSNTVHRNLPRLTSNAMTTTTDGGGGTTGGGASAACKIQHVSGGGQHSAVIVETGSTGFA